HPIALLFAPFGTLVVAAVAAVGQDRALGAEAASLAGIVVTTSAVAIALAESARRSLVAEREWIGSELPGPGRRVDGEGSDDGAPSGVMDFHPGEHVLVETGEVVPVDVVVAGGDVEVLPWIGATTPVRRREGDSIVAGARVLRGRLRGVCTW